MASLINNPAFISMVRAPLVLSLKALVQTPTPSLPPPALLISPTIDGKAFNQLRGSVACGDSLFPQRDLIKADFSLSSVYRPRA